jgi:hypothetical protein
LDEDPQEDEADDPRPRREEEIGPEPPIRGTVEPGAMSAWAAVAANPEAR